MRKILVIIIFLMCATLFSLAVFTTKQVEPRPVTLAEYNRTTGRKDSVVLVFFYADWCLLCDKIQLSLKKVESRYGPSLRIMKINTDRDTEVADEFEMDSLPALILYYHGSREWIYVGVISEKDLFAKLDQYIEPPKINPAL